MVAISANLRVKYAPIGDVRPYEDNPRRNDEAVEAVAASLREFGWKQPIVVDADGTIIVGHTRYKAALALEMTHVPVVVASDLTPEQCAAYRLADNRVGELAEWDSGLLAQELDGLADFDMEQFGFTEKDMERAAGGVDFSNFDAMSGEGDEEYDAFVDKFKPKKTTDDCYTPPEVYEVIKGWACERYGIDPAKVVRPFYPGGDYKRFDYSGGKVVVDNPPFSILAEIQRFYLENGVPFFLFCPSLTALSSAKTLKQVCHLIVDCSIEYENGAVVKTSFVTSYKGGEVVAETAPDLTKLVNDKVAELRAENAATVPKYDYPVEVLTAAMMNKYAKYGIEFSVGVDDCEHVSALDAQREVGAGIYGGGLLLSERAAAERAAAERAAAERAAATKWELSDREREIVKSMGGER